MSLKTYRAISAFAQGNTRYDKGVLLSLTDKQAEFMLLGGFIELVPVEGSGSADAAANADTGSDTADSAQSQPGKKGGKT